MSEPRHLVSYSFYHHFQQNRHERCFCKSVIGPVSVRNWPNSRCYRVPVSQFDIDSTGNSSGCVCSFGCRSKISTVMKHFLTKPYLKILLLCAAIFPAAVANAADVQ